MNNYSATDEQVPELCPNCEGNQFNIELRDQRFLYGKPDEAVELIAEVPVYTCTRCKFEFTGEGAEQARHEAVCQHLGVLTPEQIINLRKSNDMSRREFAELSKVGTASLARWEAGIIIQNAANDQLLYLLHFKDNIERLRNRVLGEILPELRAEANNARLVTESAIRIRTTARATSCRRSIHAQFRAIANAEERRTIADAWSLRREAHRT